jgi:hypothetical protein
VLIETDISVFTEIHDPFETLGTVKRAWYHSYMACPKYLTLHKAIPAYPMLIEKLEGNGIVIERCDCIEWTENKPYTY